MSRIGVVIAIVVALALAGLAWFLLGPTSAPSSTPFNVAPLLAFAPSEVQAVELERPGGAVESLTRRGERWRLTVERDSASPSHSWPIASEQMRGLLDVLRRLTPEAPAPEARLTDPALQLRLVLAGDRTATLQFGAEAVGGRRLAQANDEAPVYIDQAIYRVLTEPGPRAWREQRIFESVGVETSRIEIESDDSIIALARVREQWFLREPTRAPADAAMVNQLLNKLSALAVTRWIDQPADQFDRAAGSNRLRIAIEQDRRSTTEGESRVETDRQEIVFGGAADLSGAERLALIGDARTPAAIAASSVAGLTLDPLLYLSRTALALAASQVGAIRLTAPGDDHEIRLINRTIDGWSISHTGAESSAAPANQVQQLLTLLLDQIAARVAFDLPEDATPIMQIELLDFQQGPLAQVMLFTITDGLAIQTGDVVRLYPGVELPRLLNADSAATTPAAPETDDPIK